MEIGQLQQLLFTQIKNNLPGHISLVQEISKVLDISNDSAYRRIRGEKAISFKEVCKMAEYFSLSLDQFVNPQSDSVIFSGKYINQETDEFEHYLQGILKQLQYFNSFNQKELYYLNKDIPIFHHFMFPELASFKCYFWSRYNLNYSQFNEGKFLIEDFNQIFNTTGKKISDLYLQIPSTEVWNLDCINTTIRQIQYYQESKIFASHEDIITIYSCLEKLVDHIENQVEAGVKFPHGKSGAFSKARYRLFLNEFVPGDNTIVVELDHTRIISLNHNVINYIITRDEKFVNYTYNTLQTLLKKSTLISEVGNGERHLFFDGLREKIHANKKLVH